MASKYIRARIGTKVFSFRPLNFTEFVEVQDVLGNPTEQGAKMGAAFRLACQSTVELCDGNKCKASDLNDALDSAPGAIMPIGSQLYANAQKGYEILGEEPGAQ